MVKMLDARRCSAGVGLRTTTLLFCMIGRLLAIGLVCCRDCACACIGLFRIASDVGISVGKRGSGGALASALGVSGGLSVAVVP